MDFFVGFNVDFYVRHSFFLLGFPYCNLHRMTAARVHSFFRISAFGKRQTRYFIIIYNIISFLQIAQLEINNLA